MPRIDLSTLLRNIRPDTLKRVMRRSDEDVAHKLVTPFDKKSVPAFEDHKPRGIFFAENKEDMLDLINGPMDSYFTLNTIKRLVPTWGKPVPEARIGGIDEETLYKNYRRFYENDPLHNSLQELLDTIGKKKLEGATLPDELHSNVYEAKYNRDIGIQKAYNDALTKTLAKKYDFLKIYNTDSMGIHPSNITEVIQLNPNKSKLTTQFSRNKIIKHILGPALLGGIGTGDGK